MELSNSVFVAMAIALSWQQHFLQPNLSFKALIVLYLFRIMLSKCRRYTPEPRFQTTNRET